MQNLLAKQQFCSTQKGIKTCLSTGALILVVLTEYALDIVYINFIKAKATESATN